MKSKTFSILFLVIGLSLSFTCSAQNYLGYSKDCIMKSIKAQRKDLKGPVIVKNDKENYIVYSTRNSRRAVIYYFQEMPVTLDNGKQMDAEICIKYYSKNKCQSYTACPQMDEVARSLDSHFDKGGTYLQWIDHTRRNPQEWILVRDNDYFEVHVSEKR